MALAAELGAAVAIDYSEPEWAARVRVEVGAVGLAFDGVGGEIGRAAFGLLADGGRFVPYGMASGAFTSIPEADVASRRIIVSRPPPRDAAVLSQLTRRALQEAVAGRLRPVIGQTYPLERAADAHAAIETRATVGKTLLLVGSGQRAS